MTTTKATAIAHPNMALVKYWGKRDETLMLPHQSSLAVTLSPLEVRTSVEWGSASPAVVLHGRGATEDEAARVRTFLERAAVSAGRDASSAATARVVSEGNFPMAAGLASSSAAFAALAVATRASLGLERDVVAESRLARLGSGSACRSVQGGFCVWSRGKRDDGEDSYATQLAPSSHWPELRMVAVFVDEQQKAVSSRDGMRETVKTSPYYRAWVESAEAEVVDAKAAVEAKDLAKLGDIGERNAWRMHATTLAANPPVVYLLPGTLALIHAVHAARAKGLPVWFTLDAGPNPVLVTDAPHLEKVKQLAREHGAKRLTVCEPGNDARLETP